MFFLNYKNLKKKNEEFYFNDLIYSIPVSFCDNNFLNKSKEKYDTFILNVIISQNRNNLEEKFYFINDYITKKDDSWYMLFSKKELKQMTYLNLWREIIRQDHYPIVLIYVKYLKLLFNKN